MNNEEIKKILKELEDEISDELYIKAQDERLEELEKDL